MIKRTNDNSYRRSKSLTLLDIGEEFRKKYPEECFKYKLNKRLIKAICVIYNTSALADLFINGNILCMGNLGHLYVKKFKYDNVVRRVDWKHYKETKEKIFLPDFKDTKVYIKWKKPLISSTKKYTFNLSLYNKRLFSELEKEGKLYVL